MLMLCKYYIPIIGLFQGRIIDRPEQAMISTVHSSGGEAEHEVSVLLIYVDFKFLTFGTAIHWHAWENPFPHN